MSALREWVTLLGDRATDDTGPHTQNLTEFRAREIVAVLRPKSVSEIREIVAIAVKHRTPLYPISTGKNWGLGSRMPVQDGCAIVDLGQMNQILEINHELGYAVIEPGVTQRQLADALVDSPVMLNVTGSGEHTSVVGNALERGIGVLGQRVRELRGVEAVLANGELIRTGLWTFDVSTPQWHHYPEGSGPDIMGLFVQSGFGIVTKAVIGLHLRQPVQLALVRSSSDDLPQHIDEFRRLRQLQLLRDRIEISTNDDPRLAGFGSRAMDAWMTWLALFGDEPMVTLVKDQLSKSFSDITYYSPDDELPEPAQTRLRKLMGEPGDEYVHAMAGRAVDSGTDFALDDDPAATGFVCVLPAVPFTGQCVHDAISIVRKIDAKLGVQSILTFNSLGTTGLEGFFRVPLDRTDKSAIERTHKWAKQAQEQLAQGGFRPLRASIDNMYYDSGHLEMVLKLRQTIDPRGIIAPGRYLPN
jgi:4-cresol dehydrogenase (hydroxylating)